ncbi:DUF2461 domain-containing protein [Pedobacter sp. N23S346]|uniref:DUF2461 domain-containing protein n=1 Tax=Pedobacter sp. N23S346 TaxID=3402750 RepID=UPI003ACB292C
MLNKATFTFLSKLTKNNNTEWMNNHRDAYNNCMDDFSDFVQMLINEIAQFDNDISKSDLKAKDCIPRLNRDLRFSKDKSPYKTYLYAVISKNGRKSGNAVYYIVIKPGESGIGAGAFQPEKQILKKLHQEIDFNLKEWLSIVEDKGLLSKFPEGIISNQYLKKTPKDTEESNPALKFLKMKDFYVDHHYNDEFFLKKENLNTIIESYKSARKLKDFINTALAE